MIIKDLEGRSFEIRDLEGTFATVNSFLCIIADESMPSLNRLEERRVQYWQDFKEKLMAEKKRFNSKA